MPNIAGKAFKDAKAELENAKLTAERLEAEEFSREVAKGAVIRQSHRARYRDPPWDWSCSW